MRISLPHFLAVTFSPLSLFSMVLMTSGGIGHAEEESLLPRGYIRPETRDEMDELKATHPRLIYVSSMELGSHCPFSEDMKSTAKSGIRELERALGEEFTLIHWPLDWFIGPRSELIDPPALRALKTQSSSNSVQTVVLDSASGKVIKQGAIFPYDQSRTAQKESVASFAAEVRKLNSDRNAEAQEKKECIDGKGVALTNRDGVTITGDILSQSEDSVKILVNGAAYEVPRENLSKESIELLKKIRQP